MELNCNHCVGHFVITFISIMIGGAGSIAFAQPPQLGNDSQVQFGSLEGEFATDQESAPLSRNPMDFGNFKASSESQFANSTHHFDRIPNATAFTNDTFQEMTGVPEENSFIILDVPESNGLHKLQLVTIVDGLPQLPINIGYALELHYSEIYGRSGSISNTVNSENVALAAVEADGLYQITTDTGWAGIAEGFSVTFTLKLSVSGNAKINAFWPVNYNTKQILKTLPEPFQRGKFDDCDKIYTDCQLEAIASNDDRRSQCGDLWLLLGGSLGGAATGSMGGPWGILVGAVAGPFGAYYGCLHLSENEYDNDCKRCRRAFNRCIINNNTTSSNKE